MEKMNFSIADKHTLIEFHYGEESITFTITDICDFYRLLKYSIKHCSDFQYIFFHNGFNYQTCFADPEEIIFQNILEGFKEYYPELWGFWKKHDVDEVMISFPEI